MPNPRRCNRGIAPIALATLLLAATPTAAAEGGGCGRFAFDVARQRVLLADAGRFVVRAGDALRGGPPLAFTLALSPSGSAPLPVPPERARRDREGFAGHASVTIAEPGPYRIALSEEGWIDAVQEGARTPAGAFSGVRDCPGLRKVVKFELRSGPLLIQVSGAPVATVSVAVTPDR